MVALEKAINGQRSAFSNSRYEAHPPLEGAPLVDCFYIG
jgi:hypothetical protein